MTFLQTVIDFVKNCIDVAGRHLKTKRDMIEVESILSSPFSPLHILKPIISTKQTKKSCEHFTHRPKHENQMNSRCQHQQKYGFLLVITHINSLPTAAAAWS